MTIITHILAGLGGAFICAAIIAVFAMIKRNDKHGHDAVGELQFDPDAHVAQQLAGGGEIWTRRGR